MVQPISYAKRSASKPSKRSMMADYDELWFPEEFPFGGESEPPAVSQEENLEELLMMVDSLDAEDSLKPGIYAENFDESQSSRDYEDKCPQTPPSYALERPKTPPTTKPSFHELPPIISPECMDRDSVTGSPINEAFLPPPCHSSITHPRYQQSRYSYHCQRYPHRPLDSYEQRLMNKLAHCMRQSHASRREILRRKQFFGNHPALYEFERLEGSHRRVWMFISSQQQPPPPPVHP